MGSALNLLLPRFPFGDYFKIVAAPRRSLDANAPRYIEKPHRLSEDGGCDGVRQEISKFPTTEYFAMEFDVTERRG